MVQVDCLIGSISFKNVGSLARNIINFLIASFSPENANNTYEIKGCSFFYQILW